MKVCICVNSLDYAMGGVSVHILDLCRSFQTIDAIEKIVVCCDGGEHIEQLVNIGKVQYVYCPFTKYDLSLSGGAKLYKLIQSVVLQEKIDIIHIHSQRLLFAAYLIKLKYKIPYLWTNHIDAIPMPRLFKLMCRVMTFPIISVSESLKKMMISQFGCSEDQVTVVNNGTNIEELKALSDNEKKELDGLYRINRNNTPYVICLLSRIFYVKGHKLLIEAISTSKYKSKIKLIIAGHTYPEDTNYYNELVNMVKEKGIDATFLGYSKPRDVFGISNLFVLPSKYEGFPLVCIEALAMGCAVIRSKTPGWSEINAWIDVMENYDATELKNLIDNSIQNNFNSEKTLMGQEAVKKQFSKEICAINTIAVYKKVIESNK